MPFRWWNGALRNSPIIDLTALGIIVVEAVDEDVDRTGQAGFGSSVLAPETTLLKEKLAM